MPTKAAIYARVSTHNVTQATSPTHQIEECMDYASKIGLFVPDDAIYTDIGVSGAELERREGLQRLLDDAAKRKFNAVIFTSISRFSRNLSDVFVLKHQLEHDCHVRLISINEGYDSAIPGKNDDELFAIYALTAAKEIEQMSKSIKRGLKWSAKHGHHIGNVTPYGYVKSGGRLVIDPSTSFVVKQIFTQYIDGLSAIDIANRLNESNIPSPKGGKWRNSTINAILKNPVYKGDIVAMRWEDGKTRDSDEWIVSRNAHEPIISPDIFQRVQEILKYKQNNVFKRNSNLLAGVLFCGQCNKPMIVTNNVVMCSQVKRIGKRACPNHAKVDYSDVLRSVKSTVGHFDESNKLEANMFIREHINRIVFDVNGEYKIEAKGFDA